MICLSTWPKLGPEIRIAASAEGGRARTSSRGQARASRCMADVNGRNEGTARVTSLLAMAMALAAGHAHAQRADENVITSAEDAFGTTVGLESIGLYDPTAVRGFSPTVAGNIRIEGLYFDQQAPVSNRLRSQSDIRVGSAALGYPFPAPTGIVDVTLRPSGEIPIVSADAGYGPIGSVSLVV